MTINNVIQDFNGVLSNGGYQIDQIITENGEYDGVFKRDFAWDKVIGFVEI